MLLLLFSAFVFSLVSLPLKIVVAAVNQLWPLQWFQIAVAKLLQLLIVAAKLLLSQAAVLRALVRNCL